VRVSILNIGALALVLTGCSSGTTSAPSTTQATAPATTTTTPAPPVTGAPPAAPRRDPASPIALVTAERLNELVAVSLPGGRVLRRVHVAADPTTVAAGPDGSAVAVSPGSGRVTLLSRSGLRPVRVLRGFRSPQIAAVMPDGRYALVSDAGAGTLSSIDLSARRVVGRVRVGAGAHHIAISPDGRTAWVALGETATTIVVVDCADPRHMHALRRLHPTVPAHDLAFSPDGRTVWVTSASAPYVSVLDARTGRVQARVPAGRAPQHILFSSENAYITSGYGSSIEMVNSVTRLVVRRARLPYGSFNLATFADLIVTTSLLNGRITVLHTVTLRRVAGRAVAPNARAVAIVGIAG
jgi:YVTN family beta-propeller protein